MTSPRSLALATIGTTFAVLAAATAASGIADPTVVDPMHVVLDWLKVIGGVIGMVVGIGGTIFYYRAVLALKTNDAAKSAIDMYQRELDAARLSRERVYTENTALTKQINDYALELSEAKQRTDLSTVMANQREALAQNASLNQAIVDTLHSIKTRGDQQYTEALGVLQGIVAHLDAMAIENKQQLARNSDTLATVLQIAQRLEKRYHETARRLDDIEDKTDGTRTEKSKG